MSTRWLVWVKAKEAEEAEDAPAAVGWEVEDMVFYTLTLIDLVDR